MSIALAFNIDTVFHDAANDFFDFLEAVLVDGLGTAFDTAQSFLLQMLLLLILLLLLIGNATQVVGGLYLLTVIDLLGSHIRVHHHRCRYQSGVVTKIN